MQLIKKENLVFWGIVFFFWTEITYQFDFFFKINLPLLRYGLASIGIYYYLKGTYFSKDSIIVQYNVFTKAIIYLLSLFTLYIILIDITTIFSPNSNFVNLKKSLSGYLAVFFIPFMLYWRINLNELQLVANFSKKIGIFYIIISILFFNVFTSQIIDDNYGYAGESVGAVFGSSMALILLTFPYHSNKTAIISLLTITIALIINAILARRNQVAYFSSIVVFTIILNIFFKPKNIKVNKFIINSSIFIFAIVSIILFFRFQNAFSTLFEKVDDGFSSRELVIEEFIEDFDSNPTDWIWGRGVFGTFKSRSLGSGDDLMTRDVIENGYYYLILKGGYIYLGLFIVISFISIINGLFLSKNILSKAFACLIFTQYIEMFGFGLPTYTIKYFIFWISVTAGLSPNIYKKTDLEIIKQFKL